MQRVDEIEDDVGKAEDEQSAAMEYFNLASFHTELYLSGIVVVIVLRGVLANMQNTSQRAHKVDCSASLGNVSPQLHSLEK